MKAFETSDGPVRIGFLCLSVFATCTFFSSLFIFSCTLTTRGHCRMASEMKDCKLHLFVSQSDLCTTFCRCSPKIYYSFPYMYLIWFKISKACPHSSARGCHWKFGKATRSSLVPRRPDFMISYAGYDSVSHSS